MKHNQLRGVPNYAEIRSVIPKHCFERSLIRSSSYLASDLAAILILLLVILQFKTRVCLWPLYWIVQGCFFTAVWVIAHECGHGAFSNSKRINHAVGFVLHTMLLVPYFSWRSSHATHHRFTNHIHRDEVFVPSLRPTWLTKLRANQFGRVVFAVVTLTLGWPLYLLFNVSGKPYERAANHFDPNSPIFHRWDRRGVIFSNFGLVAWSFFLFAIAWITSLKLLVAVYGVPLLVANGWLVLITFLQHTDEDVPHYDSTRWNWLEGALSTVDRDFGVLNFVFHHITDTHVVHHLFPTIPHYHAREATARLADVLGDAYRRGEKPFCVAFWSSLGRCLFAEQCEPGTFRWRRITTKRERRHIF